MSPQVAISEFKDFLGHAVAATRAVGLLQMAKAPGFEATAFTIPQGAKFVTGGKQYATAEVWEIPESKTDPTDVAVSALRDGAGGNLPAGQVWESPVLNIVATNPDPISGGADQKPGLYPQDAKNQPSDNALQRALDVSHDVIKAMLSNDPATELDVTDNRIKQAILLLSAYRLQQNLMQEQQVPVPSQHGAAPMETRYFRARVYKPLMVQITQLLSHKIDWGRAINGPPST